MTSALPSVTFPVSPSPHDIRPLSHREFTRFQKLIRELAGIHLTAAKKPLLYRRLSRRLRELGLRSFSAYYRHLEEAGNAEQTEMIDAICTNETRFFREARHFEFIEKCLLPRWQQAAAERRRPRSVRAWSAACSTGEEPFSLAMVLLSRLPPTEGWQVKVLATDLSTRVRERVRSATWPVSQATQIPETYRKAFMLRGTGSQDGLMRADENLESVVRFDRVNLNDRSYPVRGVFDLIFCRNVMIYFDNATKQRVVEQLLHHLAPGGLLFVGLAESLRYLELGLRGLEPGIYERANESGAPAQERA